MHSVTQPNSVIRFGMFEADLRSGELRKNGVKVKIQDLPFRALKLLLSRPNEVLSREQFRQTLWPEGVFVDFDHGISSAINRLRDALGDSAENPVFIETVERRGYRWIAPTHVAPLVVRPGPVLIKAEPETPVKIPSTSPQRWRWALVTAMIALLLAAWILRPLYVASKASATKRASVALQTSGSARHAANPEAEQFYLKGRFYWEKRTPDALNKALDFFTQAIVHDANYAPAYVGLADCYNLLREYTLMPASEAYPRAFAAAKKAVELDDQSAEAHASLAFATFYGMWDAVGSEREFRRAIELNPNNAIAHHWYATYLSVVGRGSEALSEIERAQALDPASKSILADKGDLLYVAGRHEESVVLLKQLETAEPDFLSPHRYLKTAYLFEADYPNYLAELRKEATLLQDPSAIDLADAAKKGFASGGVDGMLRNTLAQQQKLYERGALSPVALAETYAELGNKPESLRYLKIAIDRHDEQALNMQQDLFLQNLRDEPVYRELVARLGFPTPLTRLSDNSAKK